MASSWLTFQSFQHSQEVLKAINTLSIHIKLTLAGVPHKEQAQAVEQAIAVLSNFLREIEDAVQRRGQAKSEPPLGIDPRLRQLANDYLAARQHRKFRSRLSTDSIAEIRELLHSHDRDDQRALDRCLDELRVLIEEHMNEDINQILGTA